MSATIWTLVLVIVAYSVGKGIGKAQGRTLGRRDQLPPIHLMLELEGNVIGGLSIGGVRVAHGPDCHHNDPPVGPPPRRS